MNIAIIGGGASGMLLASMIKKHKVTLFEKNSKLGKKLLLTGNGKCNFTNNSFKKIKEIYNSDFAINIYRRYDKEKFIQFFYDLGIEYEINNHRNILFYYPKTNKASSVYNAIFDKIIFNKTIVKLETNVLDIKKEKDKFIVITNDRNYSFDKIVISTGGNSYNITGCCGDGYKISKKFGHNIIKPLPALSGYRIQDFDLEKKGIRVYTKVSAFNENLNKIVQTEIGEVQFSGKTISGYPVMNISRVINRDIDKGIKYSLKLDLTFGISNFNSVEYLIKRKEKIFYRQKKNFFSGLIDDNIAKYIFKKAAIKDLDLSVSYFSNSELMLIFNIIKNFNIKINSFLGFDDAQLTIGGVDTEEINNKTLESKKVKGLYFTGEVMDIDGKCGGYNLQMCFSTASVVFEAIGG